MAASLESDCTTLYTKDLQHSQIIDGKLTIINPFSRPEWRSLSREIDEYSENDFW